MGVVKASKGVVGDIRRRFGGIKERVLEKMAAAAVPVDALDNARHLLETTVRDVTVAAQGLTKDALHRLKTQLVDVLPSLSPAITTKMVDEADKEANRGENAESERGEEESNDHDHQPPRHDDDDDDDDDSTHVTESYIDMDVIWHAIHVHVCPKEKKICYISRSPGPACLVPFQACFGQRAAMDLMRHQGTL